MKSKKIRAKIFFFLALSLTLPTQSKTPFLEENEKILSKISKKIEENLQEKMGGADLKMCLDPSSVRSLKDFEGMDDFKLVDVSFTPETKRFVVKISFGSQPTLVLQGRFSYLKEVPMVSRSVQKGEKIQEEDVTWSLCEETPFSRRAATKQALADATPRYKPLEPGQMITAQDIQRPGLVEQGSLITVIYKHGGLTVKTLGKALDSGAKGDTIRVQNQESKKIFSATIEAKNQVRVIPITGR